MRAAAVGAVRRGTVAALVAAAVASAACSGGSGGSPDQAGPSRYTGTPAQFESELRALAADLAPASPGAVAAQEKVVQACLRLQRMRDTFLRDIPSRGRAGMKDTEYVLLHQAANNCTGDPGTARKTLEGLIAERHR